MLEQHLLFHKALIDDNVASEKIDRYLNILNEAPDCERMQDPVDESIRTVFRLVLEQDFDPWSIDLREFVRTYTAKVNSHNKFDIIVAGKLILMAWKVLRMQTDATKMESDRNDAMFEFEEFEEAREEIIASVERERVRQELKAKEPKVFDNKAHKEVSENDVEAVWQRIQKVGTGAFPLTDLFVPNVDDNITVFLSVLQLVRDGKLNIYQMDLPYGEIMVDIKVDWMSGKLEDADVAVKVPEAVA